MHAKVMKKADTEVTLKIFDKTSIMCMHKGRLRPAQRTCEHVMYKVVDRINIMCMLELAQGMAETITKDMSACHVQSS